MDGNGRWAHERGLPRLKGHERGAESVRAVTEECVALGVDYLTLYAFSTEIRFFIQFYFNIAFVIYFE